MRPAMNPVVSQRTARRVQALPTGLLIASVLLVPSAPAIAQVADPSLWVPNAPLSAIVRDGNTIYIAGAFTHVGPPTGASAPLSATTGEVLHPFPVVAGDVRAV